MATKMVTALALEGQFSQDGLAALTKSSGGSLANELAKRFVGNKIAGVESVESIWGKMAVTPTHLVPITLAAVITDLEEALFLIKSLLSLRILEQRWKKR
jgi:hypothetical protein